MPISLPRTIRLLERGIAEGLHFGAQLYISLRASDGGPRVSIALGERAPGEPMDEGTPNIWLSSTKPVTAVALGVLWQEGMLRLDDTVAHFVPEFAAHGKDQITLRHLLTHTAGIRMLNLGWPEATWDEIIAGICARKPEPRWPIGKKAGYHLASSWFILGEVIARVAGRPFPEFVRERVLEPCGMDGTWIGMPQPQFDEIRDHLGRMYGTENGQRIERRWHEASSVVGSSPGGNGRGPIRELGLFYEMLLNGGVTRSGQHVLTPQTVAAMTTPHRVGLFDHTFKQKLDWGLGFIVDSKHYGESSVAYGYGPYASRRTFGHSGYRSSTGFADPEHDLVVALLVNGQPSDAEHGRRFDGLTGAIYQDLGLAPEVPSSEDD
ncbi:MAG: serine hydrolase domain-containing protein [Acidobacteriota bacterium]